MTLTKLHIYGIERSSTNGLSNVCIRKGTLGCSCDIVPRRIGGDYSGCSASGTHFLSALSVYVLNLLTKLS